MVTEIEQFWRRESLILTGVSEPRPDSDSRPFKLGPYVGLLRIPHWIKSLFILLPLPFAVASGGDPDPLNLALGILGFSLLSSGVYIFNDIHDRHSDQKHPVKKQRAVAAGIVSPVSACLWGILVSLAGFALLSFPGLLLPFSPEPWLLGGCYLAGNVLYTFWARSLPWLDVLFLASFFLARLTLGCSLMLVKASGMLIVTGFLLALNLALGKRYSELTRGYGPEYRPSLSGYRLPVLSRTLALTMAACGLTYLWYCLNSDLFKPGNWWWSVVVVALGLFLYFRELVFHEKGRDPVEVVLKSVWPRWIIPLWILMVILGIKW